VFASHVHAPYVYWDLYLCRSSGVRLATPLLIEGRVLLSHVPQTRDGQWARLVAMDPDTLSTRFVLWAPVVSIVPTGLSAEGLESLDQPTERQNWLLLRPGGVHD
jgi:hypothetical protein